MASTFDISSMERCFPFVFEPNFRACICTLCGHAVCSDRLQKHFNDKKHREHRPGELERKNSPWVGWDNDLKSWVDVLFRRVDHPIDDKTAPIEAGYTALIPASDGFRCTYTKCLFAHANAAPVRSHAREHDGCINSPSVEACKVWQFWGKGSSGGPTWSAIDAPLSAIQGSLSDLHCMTDEPVPEDQPSLAAAIQRFKCLQHEERRKQSIIPEILTCTSRWQERTKWQAKFVGRDMAPLMQLTSHEAIPSDRFDAPKAYTAVIAAIQDWNRHLCEDPLRPDEAPLGHFIRRLLYTVDKDHVSGRPMEAVRQEATLLRYARTWARCILFLLRLASLRQEVPSDFSFIPLTERQSGLCVDLVQSFPLDSAFPVPDLVLQPFHGDDLVAQDLFDGAEVDAFPIFGDDFPEAVEFSTAEPEGDDAFASPSSDPISTPVASPEPSFSQDFGDIVHVTSDYVLELSRAILEQSLSTSEWDSPLTWFLGLLGFNLQGSAAGTWRLPFQHSPTLSHVVYILRLVAVGHIVTLKTTAADSSPPFVEQVRHYCDTYLRNGSGFIFDDVFNLRALTLEYAKNWYRHPEIQWSPDRTFVQCGRGRLQVDLVPKFVTAIIQEAETALLDLLGHQDASFLTQFEPGNLTENMTWASAGDSIVTFNDGLSKVVPRFLSRLPRQDRPPRWARFWNSDAVERGCIVAQFDTDVTKLQKLCSLLVVMVGGPPPRAEELRQLIWRNTHAGLRSLFVVGSLLVLIFPYNKAEAVTKQPRLIARGYPPRVGRLLVALISLIYPLRRFLRVEAQLSTPKDDSDLLFPLLGRSNSQGVARHISPTFVALSFVHLGIGINVHTWRHLAILFGRDIIRPKLTSEIADAMEANFALQAGHQPDVERRHYAISADDLTGLSAQGLEAFLTTSQHYHAWFGIGAPSPPPESVPGTRKRGRPSNAVQSSDGYLLQMLEQQADTIRQICSILETRLPSPKRPRMATLVPASSSVATEISPTEMVPETSFEEPDPFALALDTLRSMFPSPTFSFRSPAQKAAVKCLLSLGDSKALFVRLRTGGGKTLLPALTASLYTSKTTVMVVPFLLLRENLLERLRSWGVKAHAFSTELQGRFSLLLVTPEAIDTPSFRSYAASYLAPGQVSHVFWDEAHLIINDSNYRPAWQRSLTFLARHLQSTDPADVVPSVPFVFLSATCPGRFRREILDIASISYLNAQDVHEPSNVPGLRWEVAALDSSGHLELLQRHVFQSRQLQRRVVVFVMSIAVGTKIAAELGVEFYHSNLPELTKTELRRAFEGGTHSILVATTAAGHGWDCAVDQVILYGGVFHLLVLPQLAGRTARGPNARGECIIITPPAAPVFCRPSAAWSADHDALQTFLHGNVCRRQTLSAYIDEQQRKPCDPTSGERMCDVCERSDARLANAFDMVSSPRPPPPSRVPTQPSPSFWIQPSRTDSDEVPVQEIPANPAILGASSSPPPAFSPAGDLSSASSFDISSVVSATKDEENPFGVCLGPATASRRELIGLLRSMWDLRSRLRVMCDFCWITIGTSHSRHPPAQCGQRQAGTSSEKQSWNLREASKKLLQRQKAVSVAALHFACFTPNGFEPGGYQPREDCAYAGWLWRILLAGICHPVHQRSIRRLLFGHHPNVAELTTDGIATAAMTIRMDQSNKGVLRLWEVVIYMSTLSIWSM